MVYIFLRIQTGVNFLIADINVYYILIIVFLSDRVKIIHSYVINSTEFSKGKTK